MNPPAAESVKRLSWLLLSATTVLALEALRFLVALPVFPRDRTVCLFHAVTHLPCVFCGGTRALVALASGEPGDAFLLNPLVTGAAVLLVLLPPVGLLPAGERALRAGRRVLLRPRVLATLLGIQWAGLLTRALVSRQSVPFP
jgi:hypothetical protein